MAPTAGRQEVPSVNWKTTPTTISVRHRVGYFQQEGAGYTRIPDALRHMGHEIARNTVKRILLDIAIEPAAERNRTVSWKTFIKADLGERAGPDFFGV